MVAVSGGPDSTALLMILARRTRDLGVSLSVAHFDHQLRGEEEARRDRDYVEALVDRFGLTLAAGSGDVRRRVRRTGESLEDAARRMRYRFLSREAAVVGAGVIVTGHTMDDQAVTVLLHLVRGSALRGLAGMSARSRWPFGRGPEVARPLLCLRRSEVETYCREAGVEPRSDPTNDTLEPTRNRIRLRVIPEIAAINPRAVEALARISESVRSDEDYLAAAALEAAKSMTFVRGSARFPRKYLAGLPRAIAGRIVRLAFERVSGHTEDLEAVHVESLLALVQSPPGELAFPHGVNIDVDLLHVTVRRGALSAAESIPETKLQIPGVTLVPGWRIETELISRPSDPRTRSRFEAHIAEESAEGGLIVRSRRPGDRLRPLGLGGEKKVQDVLVDAKVRVRERDGVPMVCASWGIAWVAGHCLEERAAVQSATEAVIHVRLERLSGGDIGTAG